MSKQTGTNYTTIMHGPRKLLGLSGNDYCVADTIYQLSRETGWCYASKEKLGDFLGITKQSVLRIVEKLISEGLVEKHESDKRLLRTTGKWFEIVVRFRNDLYGKKSYQSVNRSQKTGKNNLPTQGKKSLPNKYILYNNNRGGFSSPEKPLSLLREKNIELSIKDIKKLDTFTLDILEEFSDQCFKNFDSRPILKSKDYFIVIKAKHYLSDDQIRESIRDWFYERGRDKDKVHIAKALSPTRINSWRVENPK